ncbi:Uu.00g021010.m01.CDS01 [Anthostomella pinea]|uniref:Uu.00g021010.m01.CDS01 n=1 Tax=Anthostomella pinea TaxID=933095 RepID=A0AAI8YNQ4_9PEZI|nr:Uu.00g021010.m01.CDS01 [Anthostomella pinea]
MFFALNWAYDPSDSAASKDQSANASVPKPSPLASKSYRDAVVGTPKRSSIMRRD